MHIVHLETIRRSAAEAVEHHRGARVNPYPEGSAAHAAWLDAYYARVRDSATEAVQ